MLKPDIVDFPIKSRMIPEMFNILGFHLPQESKKLLYLNPMFSLQDVADANYKQLRDAFPKMISFGHDPAAYSRDNTRTDSSNEELSATLDTGHLLPLHLNTLRQAEQELSQADVFTRLLPAPDSARYYVTDFLSMYLVYVKPFLSRFLKFMSPGVTELDRLLHLWEIQKTKNKEAIEILM